MLGHFFFVVSWFSSVLLCSSGQVQGVFCSRHLRFSRARAVWRRRRAGRPGGTLKVAVTFASSRVLDPQAVASTSVDVARNFAVFQRLFTPKAAGSGYDGILAKSIEPNANATRWDLHLRHGVNWQDGSPFTADDVVYLAQAHADEEA